MEQSSYSTGRNQDDSTGEANYGVIGNNYLSYRQPEPIIAKFILRALEPASSVLNV
jgi:hypothetical protein